MKKSIISFILALIFFVGAGEGAICGFIKSFPEKDTPVAEIPNDDYISYTDSGTGDLGDTLKETAEVFGGEYQTYKSEDEYLDSIDKQTAHKNYVSTKSSHKPIKKIIRVLDNLTSNTVSNAIVRLNGVPRYTDKNGEVRVTLYDTAYELYVEKKNTSDKEQYNPYVEFLYIEDEKESETVKNVYLKRPSDDLEIHAVNLRVGWATSNAPEYYNLLEQSYYIALNYMDYPLDIIVETNKTPDFTYLYVNGKLDRITVGKDFIYFDYNKTDSNGSPHYKPGDKFSVQFEYNGIKSKVYDLLLGFTDLDDKDVSLGTGSESESKPENPNGDVGDKDYGIFGNFEIDFIDMCESLDFLFDESLDNLLKPIERKKWGWDVSPKFSAVFNPRKNELDVMMGFTFEYSKDTSSSSLEDLDEYINAIDNLPNAQGELEKKQDELKEIENKISDLKKQAEVDIPEKEEEIKKNIEYYNEMTEAYIASGRLNNYDLYEQRIRNGENNFKDQFNENKDLLKEVVSQIKSAGKQKKQMTSAIKQLKRLVKANNTGTGLIKSKLSFKIEIDVYGTLKYNYLEREVTEFTFTGSVEVKLAYTWQFIVMYVPIYVRVEGGVKFELQIDIRGIKQSTSFIDFLYCLVLTIEISFRADFGIGFYDALSVGGFAGFTLEFKNNIGEVISLILKEIKESDLKETYGKISFKLGLRIKILFFELEMNIPTDKEALWKYVFYGKDESSECAYGKTLQNRAFTTNGSFNHNSNSVFDSVYQDTKPQLMEIAEGKYLLVWLQDSNGRDSYNRTELVYCVYENGNWGEIKTVTQDCGLADFSPKLCKQNNDVYLTWQRMDSKITGSHSLAEMAAKSEIWYSVFDDSLNTFVNTKRVTNNSIVDFAPKFSVSSSRNDAITLLWQENSENDMLGIYGANSIVGATLTDGQWVKKTLLKSDNLISYVSGATINGKVYFAFVEDCDKDLMTSEDRRLCVYEGDNLIYCVTEDVGCPQFVEENGIISLYYLRKGNIYKTRNFISDDLVLASDTGEFNFGFNVSSNDNGITIFYESNGENSKQSYCALYNASERNWIKGIKLSDCDDYAIACTGFMAKNGTIVYSYLMTDNENTYGEICFGEKQLNYMFKITDVSYFGNLENGKKSTFTIGLYNCGDYALSKFDFEIFGQNYQVTLKDALISGETVFVNVDCIADIQNSEYEIIATALNNNAVVAEDKYLMFFGYADYEIESEALLKDGVQQYIINIKSLSEYGIDGAGILNVYLNGTLNQTFNLDSVCCGGVITSINVTFGEILKNDDIFIEFISDKKEKNLSNNYTLIKAIADSSCDASINLNPYANLLEHAKRV